MDLKPGTRIEVRGFDFNMKPRWEPATIKRWTKKSGSREDMPGWHVARYNDGSADLLMHESNFRVVDNRA